MTTYSCNSLADHVTPFIAKSHAHIFDFPEDTLGRDRLRHSSRLHRVRLQAKTGYNRKSRAKAVMKVSVRRYIMAFHQLHDRKVFRRAPRFQAPWRRLSSHGTCNGTRLSVTSMVWTHWRTKARHPVDQRALIITPVGADRHESLHQPS